jgi:hypothetical protein
MALLLVPAVIRSRSRALTTAKVQHPNVKTAEHTRTMEGTTPTSEPKIKMALAFRVKAVQAENAAKRGPSPSITTLIKPFAV